MFFYMFFFTFFRFKDSESCSCRPRLQPLCPCICSTFLLLLQVFYQTVVVFVVAPTSLATHFWHRLFFVLFCSRQETVLPSTSPFSPLSLFPFPCTGTCLFLACVVRCVLSVCVCSKLRTSPLVHWTSARVLAFPQRRLSKPSTLAMAQLPEVEPSQGEPGRTAHAPRTETKFFERRQQGHMATRAAHTLGRKLGF